MEDNLEQLSDAQLIDLFNQHDERGFNLLYMRYRSCFFGYLLKIMPGNRTLVEDIFQQSWLKVIDNIRGYDHREKFLAWLCRIGHNLAVDHFRRCNRFGEQVELNEDIYWPTQNMTEMIQEVELSEQKNERIRKLQEAIQKLPPEQQEVIRFRKEGLSFKEIAERQMVKLNTALGRMHKALEKLKTVVIEVVE